MRTKDKYTKVTVTTTNGKLVTFINDSFDNQAEVISWAKWSLKNDYCRNGIYNIYASGEDAKFDKNIRFSNK